MERSHQAADGAGEIDDWAFVLLLQVRDRVADVVGADLRVLARQGFRMAVPLHDDADRFAFGILESERD